MCTCHQTDICHQRFNNAWELNKHSESHCLDSITFEGTSSFAASIHVTNPPIPINGHGATGVYPSDYSVRERVHLEQTASLSQGTGSYPTTDFQNPPVPVKGGGVHPGQVTIPPHGAISDPSILLLSPLLPVNGQGGAEACPSDQCAKGVLPGQPTTLSQGIVRYPSTHMQNSSTPDKRSGVLPEQDTSLSHGTIGYPSILLQNPNISDKGSEVHREQETSKLQGVITYSDVNYSSLGNTFEQSTHDLTDCKMASNSLQKDSPANICSSYIAKDHSYCIPFNRQSQLVDSETLDTTENTIEYIVGENEDGYMETDENSSNSETEDSQSHGSSTDTGSESFNYSTSDRAPTKSKKDFLQCSVCQNIFITMESLRQHYTRLYSCTACGQLFSHWKSLKFHLCTQNSAAKACNICAESVLNSCVICNAFFVSEDTLLSHIKSTHSSVVRNKSVADTKTLAVKSSLPIVSGTTAQALMSNSGHMLGSCSTLISGDSSVDAHFSNGNPLVSKSHFGSLLSIVTSSALPPSPSSSCSRLGASKVVNRHPNNLVSSTVPHVVLQQSKNHCMTGLRNGQPKILPISNIETQVLEMCQLRMKPVCNGSTAAFTKDDAVAHQTSQPPDLTSIPADTTNKMPASAQPVFSSAPPLSILAMFKNNSQEVALWKRMNTNWRYKVTYPCRHCGAVSRQPSLSITHRYLHRGRRSHQCQCGRAFKHQLHLLRHWVQHAEDVSYICVNCGHTFTGARLLARHIMGDTRKANRRWKYRPRRRCRTSFSCDCGQLFVRASAYIWHQLKNRTKVKRSTKHLKQ